LKPGTNPAKNPAFAWTLSFALSANNYLKQDALRRALKYLLCSGQKGRALMSININWREVGSWAGCVAVLAASVINATHEGLIFARIFLTVAGSATIVIGLRDWIRGAGANFFMTLVLVLVGWILTHAAGVGPNFLGPIAMATTLAGGFFAVRWLMIWT